MADDHAPDKKPAISSDVKRRTEYLPDDTAGPPLEPEPASLAPPKLSGNFKLRLSPVPPQSGDTLELFKKAFLKEFGYPAEMTEEVRKNIVTGEKEDFYAVRVNDYKDSPDSARSFVTDDLRQVGLSDMRLEKNPPDCWIVPAKVMTGQFPGVPLHDEDAVTAALRQSAFMPEAGVQLPGPGDDRFVVRPKVAGVEPSDIFDKPELAEEVQKYSDAKEAVIYIPKRTIDVLFGSIKKDPHIPMGYYTELARDKKQGTALNAAPSPQK